MPNPTPELPEEITTQILQEAEIYSEEAGEYIRNVHEYSTHSDINTGYIAGAEKYASIALELRKALDRIVSISEVHGRSDCKWGDTNHNSASVAYGQNLLLEDVKHMASKALALFPVDKKKEEETNERLSDDTYTYYRIDYEDCSLEHDYIIVESLEDIIEGVRIVDTDLDDPTRESKVIITGVGLTPKQFNNLINIE